MAFKRISKNGFEGDQFKFETPGTELVGYYLGHSTVPIKGKEVDRFTFKTSSGVISTLGSKNLTEGLEDAVEGALTRVVYESMERTKSGNSFKKFTVEQDVDNMLTETASSATAAPSPAAVASAASAHSSNVASKAAQLKSQLNKTVS